MTNITTNIGKLPKVTHKRGLPPGAEHKVLTKEEKIKRKRKAHDLAKNKFKLNKKEEEIK